MATCDGPLACHVLQRCLQRYVSTTWKQNSDGKRPIELEGWLISVLGVIVDCLEKGAAVVICSHDLIFPKLQYILESPHLFSCS